VLLEMIDRCTSFVESLLVVDGADTVVLQLELAVDVFACDDLAEGVQVFELEAADGGVVRVFPDDWVAVASVLAHMLEKKVGYGEG
jgi:hypothetical protein